MLGVWRWRGCDTYICDKFEGDGGDIVTSGERTCSTSHGEGKQADIHAGFNFARGKVTLLDWFFHVSGIY